MISRVHLRDIPDRRPSHQGSTGRHNPSVLAFPGGSRRPAGHHQPLSELDCLRGMFTTELLRAAEDRARDIGVTADRVLIDWKILDEDAYVRRLASHLGVPFEDFRRLDGHDCGIPRDHLVRAAETGLLPVWQDGTIVWLIAPDNKASRYLTRLVPKQSKASSQIRLTTSDRLNQFIGHIGQDALAHQAIDGLLNARPNLSAAPRDTAKSNVWRGIRNASAPLALVAGLILLPLLPFATPGVLLSIAFLLFAALRLAGCCAPPMKRPHLDRPSDKQLPIYTVIAALHREARSVGKLIGAIQAMDYPPGKLQIILALEPDDLATRAAVARLGHIPNLQIVLATPSGPRTKPKALNCALPYVRGTFVAVYDAEDRPEENQLRAALDAFRTGGSDIACAQASLCITNVSDSWLTRTFTAEYAGQFDVFLQGASALRLPLPLGGSSNHFQTSVLRRVGGWDPYNVTEDADLGLRLARFGYRSIMFPSTTYEEAPAFFYSWLRQRTRWMKGWMQTWALHMRSPLALWNDLGARGFVAINLLVGGNVLSALAYPCLLGQLLINGTLYATGYRALFLQDWQDYLYLAAMISGFVVAVGVGAAGLSQRGLPRYAWVLALTPLYWMALSVAGWRALHQFIWDRYKWEKTEHGLAQSDHFAANDVPKSEPALARRIRPFAK